MSEQQFDIIFRGDIVFGHQLADVKIKLQQLFKADAAKIDALFTGRPVPLKRGLDQASAQKYKDVLIKAGAQVELVVVGAIQPPAPQPIKPEARSPQPLATATEKEANAPTAAPLTMAQRLAQQEAEAAKKAEIDAEIKARAAAQATSAQTGIWSLAPTGSDLLQPGEKHEFVPRDIDTSSISLRASTGNLIDSNERTPTPVASILVPNYEVAAVGTDLIRSDEKLELPLPEIDLQDWDIAEAGSDLITEDEKIIQPPVVVEIPDFAIAPAGADLGQLKPEVKAVVPDISKIKLAD